MKPKKIIADRLKAIEKQLAKIRSNNPLTRKEAADLLGASLEFSQKARDLPEPKSAESYGIAEGIEYSVNRFGPKSMRHPAVRSNPKQSKLDRYERDRYLSELAKKQARERFYPKKGGKTLRDPKLPKPDPFDYELEDDRPNPLTKSEYKRLMNQALRDKRSNPITEDEYKQILETNDDEVNWTSNDKRKRRKNPSLIIARNPGGKVEKRNLAVRRAEDFAGDAEFEKALAMYKKFHDVEPESIVEVEVADGTPKFLCALGKAPEVTYDPMEGTKKYKKARNKKDAGPCGGVPFMHEWEVAPFLATNEDGKWLGYVGMGDKYKINFLGIHG